MIHSLRKERSISRWIQVWGPNVNGAFSGIFVYSEVVNAKSPKVLTVTVTVTVQISCYCSTYVGLFFLSHGLSFFFFHLCGSLRPNPWSKLAKKKKKSKFWNVISILQVDWINWIYMWTHKSRLQYKLASRAGMWFSPQQVAIEADW